MRLLLLAFAIFQVTIVHADMVFIAIDYSKGELGAARAEAARTGEHLIILPKWTDAQEKELQRIFTIEMVQKHFDDKVDDAQDDINEIDDQLKKLGSTPTASALRAGLESQKEKLTIKKKMFEAKRDAILVPDFPVEFKLSELEDVLKDYAKTTDPKKKLTRLIIGAHHGDTSFFGDMGELEQDELRDLFDKYPRVKSDLQAVFGWGCYTTMSSNYKWWKKGFPNLQLLGGFDGSGAGPDRDSSFKFLQALLKNATEISKLTDAKKVAKAVKDLEAYTYLNGAVCTAAACVGHNDGVVDMRNPEPSCKHSVASGEAAESKKAFDIYWPPPGSDVNFSSLPQIPCDTQTSNLRSVYNHFRNYEYCADAKVPDQAQFKAFSIDADRALRLIFFHQELLNFSIYYQKDLAKLKQTLAGCGRREFDLPDFAAPLSCSPPNDTAQKQVERADVINWIHNLSKVPSSCGSIAPKELEALVTFQHQMVVQLENLDCTPLSWVEPKKSHPLKAPPEGCTE